MVRPLWTTLLVALFYVAGSALSWTNSALSPTWAARKDHLVLPINSTMVIAMGGTNGTNCFNELTLWDRDGEPKPACKLFCSLTDTLIGSSSRSVIPAVATGSEVCNYPVSQQAGYTNSGTVVVFGGLDASTSRGGNARAFSSICILSLGTLTISYFPESYFLPTQKLCNGRRHLLASIQFGFIPPLSPRKEREWCSGVCATVVP